MNFWKEFLISKLQEQLIKKIINFLLIKSLQHNLIYPYQITLDTDKERSQFLFQTNTVIANRNRDSSLEEREGERERERERRRRKNKEYLESRLAE